MEVKGVVIQSSQYSTRETIDRLQVLLQQKGATIYARIDQRAEANKAGHNLLPLEFILFGNPRAGGAVMNENPLAALDLPLKVIAWEDDQHKTWVAFNDGLYIKERYALSDQNTAPLNLEPLIKQVLAL